MSESWANAARLTLWAWLASLAACISLGPLVTTKSFLLAGAVAGLAVAAVGAVGRRLRLPIAVVVVLQVLALVEWATVSYAAGPAWAALVPTRESMSTLVDLVQAAILTSESYAPPAPATAAVEASLAAVVGGVALVVDLVAVAWRRPALVGLVFLAVYMVSVSLLAGEVPVLAFVPGALAFVFLLGAEQRDRVSHWGRQISITGSLLSARDRESVTVSTLVHSGRRVGLGAVALAVVLPVLIPTFPRTFLADGPLTGGQDSGDGDGNGTVVVDNPMLDLRRNLGDRSDSVLVTVRTNAGVPSYLRIASLDTFTGDSWQPGTRDLDNSTALDRVSSPPGLTTSVTRDRVTTDITITDAFETTWLPTLYPLTSATAEGEWGVDADELDISARSDDVDGSGLTYRATSTLVLPTEQELADTPPAGENMERYLDLPDETPTVIGDLATQVVQGAATRFEQAQALQDWFRSDGRFEYSLEPGTGDGLETITRFLQTERVGYCEQFAASMALMARTLEIPSRVAVGFLRPELRADGSWEFQGLDMHSWPELYFEGVGWVRFEPTPAARTGSAPSYIDDAATTGPSESTLPTQNTRTLPGENQSATPAGTASSGGDGGPAISRTTLLLVGGGLLALLVAVGPRVARSLRRSRRWRRAGAGGEPVAEVAWRELGDLAVDLGIRVDHRSTLRTSGRGLRSMVDDDPAAVASLNRLVVDVERSRFARAAGTSGRSVDDARFDVGEVAARLAARRSPGQRWRSIWLPASLLRRTDRAPRAWDLGGGTASGGLLLRAEDPSTG